MNNFKLIKNFSRVSAILSNNLCFGKRTVSHYPVDDNISGLNNEQKQVSRNQNIVFFSPFDKIFSSIITRIGKYFECL